MFFISDYRNNRYGVKDTEDGIVEYYGLDELVQLVQDNNIIIHGLNLEKRNIEIFSEVCAELCQLYIGTPIRLKYSEKLPEKQVLYLGYRFDDSSRRVYFIFFDGSSISGTFELSARYMYDNRKVVSYNFNNNPLEVASLIKQIRG